MLRELLRLGRRKPAIDQSSRALSVADYIVSIAADQGRSITIKKLLDIAYLAHGWHLALKGTPLIDKRIEAWDAGPVCPDIYATYRHLDECRQGAVLRGDFTIDQLSQDEKDFILDVYNKVDAVGPQGRKAIMKKAGHPAPIMKSAYGTFAPIDPRMIQRCFLDLKQQYEAISGATLTSAPISA